MATGAAQPAMYMTAHNVTIPRLMAFATIPDPRRNERVMTGRYRPTYCSSALD
jgi:hypothetical protein